MDTYLATLKRVGVPLFWRFPDGLRRTLFQTLCPARYRSLQEARASDSSGYSIKPFDQHRCIFVHIPKTAGVSVVKALFGSFGGHHTPLWLYRLLYTRAEFDAYFKFAFVRNPWDRLLSAFLFLKRGGMNDRDRRWAETHLAAYPDFDRFVRRGLTRKTAYAELHFVPQYWFLALKGPRPAVDFVGYYENLPQDFVSIRERLGVSPERRLLALNRTEGKPSDFREYYTPETRRIVAEVYREDIELFGYDFENRAVRERFEEPSAAEAATSV
jgi:hypothetical protein